MNFVHDPLTAQRTSAALGGASDAAVTAGATGSISAKLRSISRDIDEVRKNLTAAGDGTGLKPGPLLDGIRSALSGQVEITAIIGGNAEHDVPPIIPDGNPASFWITKYGEQVSAGYDLSKNSQRVHMDGAPLAVCSPVYKLIDAKSETATSIGIDCRGYRTIALHIIASDSAGGVDATVQLKRRLRPGDAGAEYGAPITLDSEGEQCIDLEGVNPGILSVGLTRTKGTVTVLLQGQV